MPEHKDLQIDPRLRFDPDWVMDPIPPWLFDRLKDEAIFRLAQVSLEHRRAVLQANLKAVEQSLEVIQGHHK